MKQLTRKEFLQQIENSKLKVKLINIGNGYDLNSVKINKPK